MRRLVLWALLVAVSVLLSFDLGGCAAGGSVTGTGEAGDAGGPTEDVTSDSPDDHPETGHKPEAGGHKDAPAGDVGEAGGESGKGGPYTIGGTVTGLVGTGLVLQDNGSDNLSITTDGAFTFAVPVASGATYDVTAFLQPTSPAQMCTVSGGTGTVGTSDVTSVVVNCVVDTYTIGGTISGLAGAVVLQNNGGDNLTVTADGSFTFATPLPTGAAYAVSVLTQPALPSQTCVVTSGTGTVGGTNVTTVVVTCTTNSFTVGGMVSGLSGSGLVLQDNGGDSLTITGNGPFTFATSLLSGSSFLVTVLTEPTSPWQTCAVTGASGTVTTAAVTSVDVVCTTSTFTIGGTITGLASGASVVLQDNLTDNLTVSKNGSFVFATPVASGAAYSATVLTQPTTPGETCVVTMGSGTVAGTGVMSIVVTCTLNAGCGRFASGYTGAWSTVAANPFGVGMGFSSYVPAAAAATIYLNHGKSFDYYAAGTNSYATLLGAPTAMASPGTTAMQGNALWSITSGVVLRYDLLTGAWTTPATGLTTIPSSQTTADDSGNVWSYASTAQLVEYNVSLGTVTSPVLSGAVIGPAPRITYDSCSKFLYLTNYTSFVTYSYDPISTTQSPIAALPGGLFFADGFCGDRSGHLFAFSTTATLYQYTIATNTWVAMPSGGPTGGTSSACGVGADGYLYATDPSVSSAMYRIQLN